MPARGAAQRPSCFIGRGRQAAAVDLPPDVDKGA
jgi:hypothetical protein